MQRGKLGMLLAALLLSTQLFPQDSEKSRVLSLENAWNEAQSHADAKAIAGLLASSFVYTDADGSFMDKAQLLASIRTAGQSHIVNEQMKAQSYGDVMVVTGIYREEGTEDGKPYTRRGRFTDTWVQTAGQWLCASSQETLISH